MIQEPVNDLTGRRFGRLEVVEMVGIYQNYIKIWRCRCDCGNETVVLSHNLKAGRTKSCGCLQIEFAEGVISKTKKRQASMAERIQMLLEEREVNH
jgi:hypothetical protein